MKNVFLSLITASLIVGFVSPQELKQDSNMGGGFTIQEKGRTGN
ncbi:hypothetical protein [Halalkalibacterium halodurans]|nr:hypothetical protein [Halalkalibacterium halodurans]MDY7224631.1 hypothetical protein [Halalkalibacterium halodurans]MDY7240754.1 hypothetical protein [Halalkalibacterium halodurans]